MSDRLAPWGRRFALLLPGQEQLGVVIASAYAGPTRHYHDLRHLGECLDAAVLLGSTRLEHLALWFHDMVHHHQPGADEAASAQMASTRLTAAGLSPDKVAEVVRLVLVTTDHRPDADDQAACRVSDADLAVLGAPADRYDQTVADLRREVGLADDAWRHVRRQRVESLLASPRLFHSPAGSRLWQQPARNNLLRERERLG